MDHGGDVRRLRFKARAHDPTDLSMWLNTLADKLCPRTKNEVSFQAFPHQMKLICAEPHIRAGTCDRVFLPAGVVGNRAGMLHLAHIGLTIKDSKSWLLRMRRNRRKHYASDKRQGRDEAAGSSCHVCLTLVWFGGSFANFEWRCSQYPKTQSVASGHLNINHCAPSVLCQKQLHSS